MTWNGEHHRHVLAGRGIPSGRKQAVYSPKKKYSKLKVRCNECGRVFSTSNPDASCPKCGGSDFEPSYSPKGEWVIHYYSDNDMSNKLKSKTFTSEKAFDTWMKKHENDIQVYETSFPKDDGLDPFDKFCMKNTGCVIDNNGVVIAKDRKLGNKSPSIPKTAKELNDMAEYFNNGSDGPEDWDAERGKIKRKWQNLSSEEKKEALPHLDEEASWLIGIPHPKDDPKGKRMLVYGIHRIAVNNDDDERKALKRIRFEGFNGTVEIYKDGNLEGMY